MTITPATLTRSAGVAAVAAGAIFIGVQINHPHLDVASVKSTEWAVRSSMKVLMAALALVGITGMYLHQVKKMGVLGLVGYLLFGANYLVIMSTSFIAAYVLPSIANTSPSYVRDALAVAGGGHATGDIGLLKSVLLLESVLYLAGGLLFGIALYRARVLPRWAAALLAVGGVVSAGLSLLPDPYFRLLAFPNGIAMIALGYSLWRSTRPSTQPTTVDTPLLTATGAQ
ncbi:MAG: hypothetical protein M3Z50_04040 [Actinomycetota bacterium]|nr:hypothetical protein [Actinomycetota bacterium]